MKKKSIIEIFVVLAFLLASLFLAEPVKFSVYALFHKEYLLVGSVSKYNMPLLALQHAEMSLAACVISIAIGMPLGIFVLTEFGSEFREIVEKLVSLTKALPQIGLIAILIPIFGYGIVPGAILLILGGMLPIVFSTISGLENVPPEMIEVGKGLGMTKMGLFRKVQLPLALPILISGVRTASIIIVGSATIAAISGAGGLGIPIFNSGVRGFDPIMLLEGAIPVSLMALFLDKLFNYIEIVINERFSSEYIN